ncbi:MAG: HesA/MoeB/ThiF family protein [Candidatus Firestonebacteria bacterium]
MKSKKKNCLFPQELERYKRQILLFGESGQKKLKKAVVAVAGAGGLGGPVCSYLALAGIGTIILCDYDRIELSNLNRQILHDVSGIGMKKVFSGKRSINRLNSFVKVRTVAEKLTEANIPKYIRRADIIIDCLDNFETRYLLNEYAVAAKIPFIYGGICGMSGQISFIHPPGTFCLACVFEGFPKKEVFPVVGAVPGVIGSLQALEAIKYLTGSGKNLKNVILTWDGTTQEFRKIAVKKSRSCKVCGKAGYERNNQ